MAIFYGVDTDALFTSTLTILTPSDDNNNTMSAIQIADLNTDGLADLVVSNHINTNFGGYGSVLIFFNLGFEPYFENSISASVADYNSMDISDFDSDGVHNDIAFCRDDGIVQVFVSIDYITGAWSWPPFYYTNGLTHSLIHGKFNNDEFDDLAVISPETSTLQILFANGYGTFTQQTYPTDRKPVSVARINFNSDQIDDIVILSCSQTANVFVGTSRSIFDRNYIPFDTHVENSGQCALSLKVADLNRDGSDDLVIVNAETRSIHVLMGMSCDD